MRGSAVHARLKILPLRRIWTCSEHHLSTQMCVKEEAQSPGPCGCMSGVQDTPEQKLAGQVSSVIFVHTL